MESEGCLAGVKYCEEFPWVNFMGVTWLEPATILTDLLISGICAYGLFQLSKPDYIHPVYRFFKLFLLLMGLATAVGGILGHGLFYLYDMNSKVPGWYLSMVAVSMFERAAIMHAKPLLSNKVGNMFALINIVELLTFMTITIIVKKFLFVEIHAVYGLFIVVFSFEIFVYLKTRDRGSLYFFLGTAMAALSAFTHAQRIAINEWFNHNDISHLGMAAAVYFYIQGAKNLKLYDTK